MVNVSSKSSQDAAAIVASVFELVLTEARGEITLTDADADAVRLLNGSLFMLKLKLLHDTRSRHNSCGVRRLNAILKCDDNAAKSSNIS